VIFLLSKLKLSIDIEKSLLNNLCADVYVNGEYLTCLDSNNKRFERHIQFDSQMNRIKLRWKPVYDTSDKIKNIFRSFGEVLHSIFVSEIEVLNCPYEYEDEFEVSTQEDTATFEVNYLQIEAVQHYGFKISHEHCETKCQKNILIPKKQLDKKYNQKIIILSVILALFTLVGGIVDFLALQNSHRMLSVIVTVAWTILVIRIIKMYIRLKRRYNFIKEKHISIIM